MRIQKDTHSHSHTWAQRYVEPNWGNCNKTYRKKKRKKKKKFTHVTVLIQIFGAFIFICECVLHFPQFSRHFTAAAAAAIYFSCLCIRWGALILSFGLPTASNIHAIYSDREIVCVCACACVLCTFCQCHWFGLVCGMVRYMLSVRMLFFLPFALFLFCRQGVSFDLMLLLLLDPQSVLSSIHVHIIK